MNPEIWAKFLQTIRVRLEDKHFQLFSCHLLGSNSLTNGVERSCTKRVYHYLLPISWHPNADEIQQWWQSDEAPQHGEGFRKRAIPPDSLRDFKEALRSAECRKLAAEDISLGVNKTLRVAAGRFGALGTQERLPFHNFADPNLRGDANPNNEQVWRVVDRARIVDFVENEHGDVVIVLEIKGDHFLKQQIRRIVGASLAITHGWLPKNVFDVSRRVDTFIETPLAPPGRLYLEGFRFHFDELEADGLTLFERHKKRTLIDVSFPRDNRHWIQRELLHLKSFDCSESSEERCLDDLKSVVSPRIRKGLHQDFSKSLVHKSPTIPCPDEYVRVLEALRRIVSSNEWPETSSARSTVIRHKETLGKTRGSLP